MTASTLHSPIAHFDLDTTRATCPRGFTASGVSCGLRKSGKPDLALFLAPAGCAVAGVFTQNVLCAAPVTLSKQHLAACIGQGRAVLINSGCANAATGELGMANAVAMATLLADALACPPEEVLIASTGVIGVLLDGSTAPKYSSRARRSRSPTARRSAWTTTARPRAART